MSSTRAYWGLTPVNAAMRDAVCGFIADRNYGWVLDVGAGNLAFRTLLEPHARRYVSTDVVPTHPELDFVAHGADLPLKAGCVDLALCSAVVEHTDKPADLLREMGRVLSPGGDMIVTAPFLHQIHGEPHDYWRFTRYGLEALMGEAGLDFAKVDFVVNGHVLALVHGLAVSVLGGLLLPVRSLRGPLAGAFGVLSGAVAAVDGIVGPKSLPAGYIVLCRGLRK